MLIMSDADIFVPLVWIDSILKKNKNQRCRNYFTNGHRKVPYCHRNRPYMIRTSSISSNFYSAFYSAIRHFIQHFFLLGILLGIIFVARARIIGIRKNPGSSSNRQCTRQKTWHKTRQLAFYCSNYSAF